MVGTVVVSSRGQITIPADVRKRLGVKAGGVMTIEESAEGLLLRPAIVLGIELETFSNEDIAVWEEDDQIGNEERARILEQLALSDAAARG